MRKPIGMILVLLASLLICTAAYAQDVNIGKNAQAELRLSDKDGTTLDADMTGIAALTDDNSFSVYSTPVGVEKGEIILDLYYIVNFNRVYMREINSTIQRFEIYTSVDKRAWTKRFSGGTVGLYGRNACFPTAKARYIKIAVTKTDNRYGDAVISFSDIKVYKTDGVVTDDLENLIYL